MPHFQKKMDLKLSVGVRYDAICIERLSQNRRTDRSNNHTFSELEFSQHLGNEASGLALAFNDTSLFCKLTIF